MIEILKKMILLPIFFLPIYSYANSVVGIASVEYGKIPFCTGVLIDRELVLTAAHCAEAVKQSKLAWVLHGDEVTIKYNVSKILSYAIHPDYLPMKSHSPVKSYNVLLGRNNDISLLKITPAPNEFVEDEIDFDFESKNGDLLLHTGWGMENSDSDIIKLDSFYSNYHYSSFLNVSKEFKGKYIGRGYGCGGDSGGPVYNIENGNKKLIGIMSRSGFTWSSCINTTAMTSTMLNKYRDWIVKISDQLLTKNSQ